MKQLLTTVLLCSFCFIGFCQSRVNEDRQTTLPRNFQEYEPSTNDKRVLGGSPVSQAIPSGSRFTIVDEIPDYYVVYFWEWTKDKDQQKRARINFENDSTTVKYFVIPKTQLDIVSEQIFRRWSPTVGALTFPFKYRPQNGKFEPTFGIGISGGVTWNPWRVNEHTFSLLAGISASSAHVDQFNTDAAANIHEASERTSVTISLNFLYQWQRLQIGISAGIDNILDNEVLKWKNQGKPWISFGVGVGLFSSSEIKSPGKN